AVLGGPIAACLRVVYTASDNPVGLAKRMESLAPAGTAYLSEHTAAFVAGFFELREVGRHEVKGVARPVGVWELLGAGALRTPFELSAQRGFSPFVDREDEMAALESALGQAREGVASVVAVGAEPGIGKSRLFHEFARRCRDGGFDVWTGHALSHARNVPFRVTLEMLRSFFGIEDGDAVQAAREKVQHTLGVLGASDEESLALLLDFLGIADPERP